MECYVLIIKNGNKNGKNDGKNNGIITYGKNNGKNNGIITDIEYHSCRGIKVFCSYLIIVGMKN